MVLVLMEKRQEKKTMRYRCSIWIAKSHWRICSYNCGRGSYDCGRIKLHNGFVSSASSYGRRLLFLEARRSSPSDIVAC